MKTIVFGLLVLLQPGLSFGHTNCDLSEYRWECDLNINQKQKHKTLFQCGAAWGYLTKQQYKTLARYQRADVNMILTLNGNFITAPCIPLTR